MHSWLLALDIFSYNEFCTTKFKNICACVDPKLLFWVNHLVVEKNLKMIFSLPKVPLPKWHVFLEKCINRIITKNGINMLPLAMMQDVSEKLTFFSKKLGLDVFDAGFRVNARLVINFSIIASCVISVLCVSIWSGDITLSNLAIMHFFLYSQVSYFLNPIYNFCQIVRSMLD